MHKAQQSVYDIKFCERKGSVQRRCAIHLWKKRHGSWSARQELIYLSLYAHHRNVLLCNFFIVGTTAVGSFENGVIPTHMLGDARWGLVLRRWAYWGPSKTIFEESNRGAATWASTKAHSSWCRYTTVLWPFTRRVALISAWQQDTDQYTVPRECGGWSWCERIHVCCLVGDVRQMATCGVGLG